MPSTPSSIDIELSLHLYRVLARAARSVSDCSADDVKRHGIQPTEFSVLELLYNKGPQAIQQIGTRILRTSGSMTFVIDKLEKAGMLVRVPDHKDRRITLAALTDKGRSIMDHVFPLHADAVHESVEGLSPIEKQQLIELLKKLGIHAQQWLQDKKNDV